MAAVARPTTLAPFALLRVAALPHDLALSIAPPRSSALIAELLDARAEAERLRAPVEDALFAAIPQLISKTTRAAAVRLKRDVHNGRAVTLQDALAESIAAELAPVAAEQLRGWLLAQATALRARAELNESFTSELRGHVRARLRSVLADGDFRRALALASPELQSALTRELSRTPTVLHANKLEKALLGYLIRAAVKTSPFSTFMHVVPLGLDEEGGGELDLSRLEPARHARLNRGVWARLADAAAAALVVDVPLRANPTIRDLGRGRLEAITAVAQAPLGRPWSTVRVGRYRFHPVVAELLLAGGTRTASEWQALLAPAGLAEGPAFELIQKLVQRGLLLAPATSDAFDPDPSAGVCRLLSTAKGFGAGVSRDAVRELAARAQAFADADADERAASLGQIRQLERTALTALGVTEIDELANVVLEDSWRCGATGALGGRLPERLREVGEFLSTQLAYTPDYLKLRRAFVERFGAGGACRDLLGFLRDVAPLVGERVELGARPRLEAPVPAPAGTRLGVTVQMQLAARDTDALAAGEVLLVLNRVHEGVGWLASRFSAGPHADHGALAARLRDWLAVASAPREPVDLVVSGHCNDLQTHPRLTDRIFAWDGEPLLAGRDGVLRPDQLTLVHDRGSDRLELVDERGRLVTLLSLGGALPTSIWGLPFVLHVLSQPFQILRPALAPDELGEQAPEVVFEPRRMHGHLVLTRARWWVRAAWVRERWLAKSGVERLLAVAEDVRAHGLPPVLFASRRVDPLELNLIGAQALESSNKPLWVDTRNPFCLDLLERTAREGEWLCLTEALPSDGDLWVELDGRRHVAELHVEMVITAAEVRA
jgi:hypothetical protein